MRNQYVDPYNVIASADPGSAYVVLIADEDELVVL